MKIGSMEGRQKIQGQYISPFHLTDCFQNTDFSIFPLAVETF